MVVDSLRQKGKIYKKMQEVSPKELGIRNKIKIYKATDTNNKFCAIFAVSQKSRLLMKDVHKFEEIYSKPSSCPSPYRKPHVWNMSCDR